MAQAEADSTETQPHFGNPLGDATASEDQVRLAILAMASAVSAEVVLLSLVAWGAASISIAADVTAREQLSNDSPQVNLIIWGTVAAIFAAGLLTWWLLSPVRSNYRRGGLAMVSALLGLLGGGILTFLARAILGHHAVLGLALVGLLAMRFFLLRTRAEANALPSARP